MKARILNRKDIDTVRWDDVVTGSGAETLYPYSWYLDAAASRWSGLVIDDYRFIMPLVWRRKYGIRYLYQPFYTQQLGVFGKEPADPELLSFLLSVVKGSFPFGTIQFNAHNPVGREKGFLLEERANHFLDLHPAYEVIAASYKNNTRRNLKKAMESGVEMVKGISCEELVAFKRKHDVIRRDEAQYRWLTGLLDAVRERAAGTVYAVREGGSLEAAAFFGYSRSRAIYLVSVSSERGKENRSMFRIVDTFIREHAGSGRILDFEGSTIPSVARFFEGFGAVRETYPRVRFSRIPFLMKGGRGDG